MSFSIFKHYTPAQNSDKYDRLSSLLLMPNQSATGQAKHSVMDHELDVHLDATFDNKGIVKDINILI